MATDLERWLGYVLLQSSAMPGISPSCRVYFSFCLTGRVPFALFQWKRLRGKLSFPDSMLSFLLHTTPLPLPNWMNWIPPQDTPQFLKLSPRRVGALAGLRFCTAWKAGCVPPGAAGQSQVDVSLWGMSQQQSWRQHCPVCRLVHPPWEAHSGYQSCSYSIFRVSSSTRRGLRHTVRGGWGLEITVAARGAHILSEWAWCPWLGEDGCFTLVWTKLFKLTWGDHGDQRQAALHHLSLLPLGSGESPALASSLETLVPCTQTSPRTGLQHLEF